MSWQSAAAPSCPPRLTLRPEGAVGSLGPEAVDLARECGLELDDWQAWYLDGCLAYDKRGKWMSLENGLCMPRQNGKGSIIEARMLAGLFLLEEPLLTYTAHQFKTAQEHFLRIRTLIDNAPSWATAKLKRHWARTAAGAEAIELQNGQRLRFLARGSGSARGFSGDVIFLDEAMSLWAAMMGDLIPTLSARGDVTAGGPQVYYFGSAGKGEQALVFKNVRGRAVDGKPGRLFFAEWAAGEPDDHDGKDVDLDNRREWYRANPAMGSGRLTEEFTEAERDAMPDDEEFARERLGLWGGNAQGAIIDPDTWRALLDPASKPGSTIALAVDVPPEGRSASISRAGLRKDGRAHVEVDTRPGTTWAADRLAELSKKRNAVVVLDGGSRAAALIPLLVARDVNPIVYTTRDITTAYSGFVDKVDEDKLRHLGQAEFNMAVDGARRRKVGDGAWAWARRDTDVNISPLVAATLAVHALKEDPPRRKTGRSMAV